MAFFGLSEHQTYSQLLLKALVGIEFEGFEQQKTDHASCYDITPEQRKQVEEINHLDVQLYDFARDLFYQRLRANRIIK